MQHAEDSYLPYPCAVCVIAIGHGNGQTGTHALDWAGGGGRPGSRYMVTFNLDLVSIGP